MTIADVLPTLLEAVGGNHQIPATIDGASQWQALEHLEKSTTPDYLVTGFNNTALYQPPWKLITGDRTALYDIFSDPTESNDLAKKNPNRVSSMQTIVDQWPSGPERGVAIAEIIFDMDTWGGEEDRAPWAEAAVDNQKKDIDNQ